MREVAYDQCSSLSLKLLSFSFIMLIKLGIAVSESTSMTTRSSVCAVPRLPIKS